MKTTASRHAPVRCARCNGQRWPYHGTTPSSPFVCQRCRLVLSAARNVVDPATPARRAAWKKSGIVLAPDVDRNPEKPAGEPVQARTRRVIAGRPETPSPDPHEQRVSGGRFLSTRTLPENSKRAGGRPRTHDSDRAALTAAQRAWRARKKQEQIARNDALLGGGPEAA
jgi:hypothetical protein